MSWTDGRGSSGYSALLPEASFRPGRNRYEIFLIEEEPGGIALASLARG